MRINAIPVPPYRKDGETILTGGYAVVLDRCTEPELAKLAAGEADLMRATSGAVFVLATGGNVEQS